MLIHDFDDEHTLAEEEAMAMAGGEDPENELNSLQKVSEQHSVLQAWNIHAFWQCIIS